MLYLSFYWYDGATQSKGDKMPDFEYNRQLAAKPGNPNAEYIDELDRQAAALPITDIRYARIQAELEDIEDGHWSGPRTDDPWAYRDTDNG